MTTCVTRGCVVILAVAFAGVCEAQTVRGEIVDLASGAPAAGVVVLLLDRADRTVAQGVTDARGLFQLSSPDSGTFRVRTLRIGYRPATSHVFTLARAAELTLPPLQAGVPVALDTIRVVGRNSCEAVSDAPATFALWEQARTALMAARIAARARSMTARIVTYERSSRPRTGEILAHNAFEQTGVTIRPWYSPPPDSLRRVGYVTLDERNWLTYHAPDLDVLLSDQFLEDHCFRIAPESSPSRIGIAFAPTRERRRIPEIAGTMWLDRSSAELRLLEFQYVNIADEARQAGAGGSVHFARLGNGAWVVSRWNIRMPVVEERYEAASARSRARFRYAVVNQIREEGGLLTLATQGNDTLYAAVPLTITGVIRDSITNFPVKGARILVRGTPLNVDSDTAGRFRIMDVLPGRYVLEVRTPQLAAVGHLHTVTVMVADTVAPLAIRLPNPQTLGAGLCPGNGAGVVAGTIRRLDDSTGAGEVKVVAEFRQLAVQGNAVVARSRWLNATSDLHGRYRICGVPIDTDVLITAESDSGNSAPMPARILAGEGIAVVDLVLDRQPQRAAVFAGVVMSDINGAPIADVQVMLPGVPRNAFTDERGTFRISNVPPGIHQVVARRIGYQQLELRIQVAANQTVERQLLLSRVVTLDTVAVRAATIRTFEDHRAVGLGKFWTRDELAKQEGRRLGDVLQATAGLSVISGGAGAAWVATSRGVRAGFDSLRNCFALENSSMADIRKSCGCYVQVYLDDMPLFSRRQGEEVPNINRVPVAAIEAIEFYSGPAQTPARYSGLNANCGVLVIHTRRTP